MPADLPCSGKAKALLTGDGPDPQLSADAARFSSGRCAMGNSCQPCSIWCFERSVSALEKSDLAR
jgi:hypothetical protein